MIVGKEDTYFTVQEFADLADVSPKTVMNWLAGGIIQGSKLGRQRFVTLSSIEEALSNSTITSSSLPAKIVKQVVFVRDDIRKQRSEHEQRRDRASGS